MEQPSPEADSRSVAPATALSPCFGRDNEVGLLRTVLGSLGDGPGRLVVIEGEPGIGKTFLLAHLLAWAQEVGFQVLSFQAAEPVSRHPFSALADSLGPHSTDSMELQLLARLMASSPLAAPQLYLALRERLPAQIERMALERPLILAVDDLHWADPASLELLHSLARRTTSQPVGIVLTVSPGPWPPELHRFMRSVAALNPSHVHLEPLSARAMESLIEASIGGAPGARLEHYLAGAAGNPRLATELATALRESGALAATEGTMEMRDASLPDSFCGLVLRRVGRLPEGTRALMQVAAILGDSFSISDIAYVLRRQPSQLMQELDPALVDGVLGEAGAHLVFRHRLVRDVIYETMALSLRRALHRQVAFALAAERRAAETVARHLVLGAVPGDREAVEFLCRAAVEALPRAPATALDLLGHALDLCEASDPARCGIVTQRALALLTVGRPRECVTMVEEHLPVLLGTRDELRLRHLLALARLQLGAPLEAAEQAEALETGLGLTSSGLSSVLGDAALARVFGGDLPRASVLAERAERAAREAGDDLAIAVGLSSRAVVTSFEGRATEALEPAMQALRHARRSRAPEAPHRLIHLWCGLCFADAERFEDSARMLRAGIRISERAGIDWQTLLYHAAEGYRRWLAGDWDDAVTEMEMAIALSRELGNGLLHPQLSAHLAYIAFQRGDEGAARALVGAADEAAAASGPQFGLEVLCWVKALLAEASGHVAGAMRLLAAGRDLLDRGCVRQYLVLGPDLVGVALATGDHEGARLAVEAVEVVAAASGLATARGIALRCRARLDGDPALLEAAVEALRQGRRRIELAFACEEAGTALVRTGRRETGVALLEEARAVFSKAGANRPVGRITAALRGLGVRRRGAPRVRRPVADGPSLSASEQKVAQLVALGLTSRAIAERLGVSRRTVETHLAHMFAKFRVSSRTQLAIEYMQLLGEEPEHQAD